LHTLGLQTGKSAARVVSSASSSIDFESILQDAINFRRQVRNYALVFDSSDKEIQKQLREERQELLGACDELRIKFKHYGLEIKDLKDKSTWTVKS